MCGPAQRLAKKKQAMKDTHWLCSPSMLVLLFKCQCCLKSVTVVVYSRKVNFVSFSDFYSDGWKKGLERGQIVSPIFSDPGFIYFRHNQSIFSAIWPQKAVPNSAQGHRWRCDYFLQHHGIEKVGGSLFLGDSN